jgi:hypothetical protein
LIKDFIEGYEKINKKRKEVKTVINLLKSIILENIIYELKSKVIRF